MVENLGRKSLLIFALLAVSLLSLWIGGFRWGLDLQGGTRLVYSVNFEKAAQEGLISEQELGNKDELFNQMRGIWSERLDPQGLRDPSIRREGADRIVIELPGSAAQLRRAVSLPLEADITAQSGELRLGGEEADWGALPTNGGEIEINGERVRYAKRVRNLLTGLERNYGGASAPAAHAANDTVDLVALDPWREMIENVGSMKFRIEADRLDLGVAADLQAELEAARQWVRDNQDSPIAEYNSTMKAREGALARLEFYTMALNEEGLELPKDQRVRAVIIEEEPNWRFDGADVLQVSQDRDSLGLPAVGFQMKDTSADRFYSFTEEHEGQSMAIIINDEIVTFPNIEQAFGRRGIIRGQFTNQQVIDLVTVLRSGSLRIKPKFEAQESVGATLGADYVKKGFLGVGLGLAFVLIFMVVYYRRLGVFAAISLIYNLILLAGALAFFQATLTLPGVAGIILTVGMAVDANILIYERIREEQLRGRKPLQSAKDGFSNALSTIVDANLTTLITAFILLKFGTGPVRGFATTLAIGIVTSMFSALVVTRVLVHLQVERGIESFSMARLVHETKIRFMALARPALILSSVLIVVGVGFYASIADEDKLGIDFLGGMTMSVRLAEPHNVEDVREKVAAIGGVIGSSSEVKEILNSSEGDGYTRFRITAKGSSLNLDIGGDESSGGSNGDSSDDSTGGAEQGPGATSDDEGDQNEVLQEFRSRVEDALSSVLQKGPIDALFVTDGRARGDLYFEREHSSEDIAAQLDRIGVADAEITTGTARGVALYHFEGSVPETKTAQGLATQLSDIFQSTPDSRGVAMALASPIDEVNAVGAQVVSELRDRAIAAILLSLFAAVMYIRVRFAEYSFGFAAVAALTHDVLITLGALAFADAFLPFVDTELTLPMIAAFLTIIGYSLNDTIVVFDRIRENLPRMKGSLSEIIDTSINQTLARTLLTSVTTLISVALLLAFNLGTGNVLEGFAFALMVGVVVGTYSSMFVACPVLLWLETRRNGADKDKDKRASVEAAPAA